MKYRVQLMRMTEQDGVIEIDAASEDEAVITALQLSELPGTVVKQPEWRDYRKGPTRVVHVSEAA